MLEINSYPKNRRASGACSEASLYIKSLNTYEKICDLCVKCKWIVNTKNDLTLWVMGFSI